MKRLFTWLAVAVLFFIPFYAFGVPTTTWDETVPVGTEAVAVLDNYMRQMKTQVREVINADHVFSSTQSGATGGYHESIHLIGRSDLGTGSSTASLLGGQLDGTDTELFYTDANDSDVQITKDGALDATSLRGAIGGTTPAAGTFTTLTGTDIVASGTLDLASGPKVNEISSDGTMADNSDSDLVTEKAVKTYADTKLGALSSYATTDSENNAMISSVASGAQHAYLAATDGMVTWSGELDATTSMTAYVDTDSNPPTGGTVVGKVEAADNENMYQTISFLVKSGQYFEFVASDTDAPASEVVAWISFGTISKPVDQD